MTLATPVMTLRFRIISLIALFGIILTAAFTALLIVRQLTVITENNQFRARVGTFAAKGDSSGTWPPTQLIRATPSRTPSPPARGPAG